MSNLKDHLSKDQTLLAPKLENPKFKALLDNALSSYVVSEKYENLPKILWGEKRFQLERSSSFRKLRQVSKDNIYTHLTRLNLALSWYIERSGHNYGAKMILLSDTQEEKSLYALFVAEEAIHQREFEHFIDFIPDPNVYWHPLLDPLAQAIKEAERETCLYVIQVLLEGFGIGLYTSLKESCDLPELKKVYSRIINDEAKHHGSGVILTHSLSPNDLVKDQVFEYTRQFIIALQSADMLGSSFEREQKLSQKERSRFYEEVEYEKFMNLRLVKLKSMLQKVDNWDLIDRLEKEKVFKFSI